MAMVRPLTAGESLALGDDGEQVGELQRLLHHLGYYQGEVDERFDDATQTAVLEFQRAAGRELDGLVEVELWEALDAEARSAGYDPDVRQDEPVESGQLSEDGRWWWDGAEWKAVDTQEPTIEAGQLSEDGQWLWDGSEWRAADSGGEAAQQAQETPAIDVSEYPDVKEGDSGEWVTYLDAMLRSKGF
jgi:hypothetical protein